MQIAEGQLGEQLDAVPSGYVGRYLNAELSVNAALADAWERVYAAGGSPTQSDVADLQRELGHAFTSMKNEVEELAARPRYDVEATASRFAVSAAVKGAATVRPDNEGPSLAQLRAMSDDQKEAYAREVSRRYAGR